MIIIKNNLKTLEKKLEKNPPVPPVGFFFFSDYKKPQEEKTPKLLRKKKVFFFRVNSLLNVMIKRYLYNKTGFLLFKKPLKP